MFSERGTAIMVLILIGLVIVSIVVSFVGTEKIRSALTFKKAIAEEGEEDADAEAEAEAQAA